MFVIPAIDIRHGQCVRLYQGKADQETVYWKDPVEMASIWVERGARMLHIADLDGAFQGKPVNLDKLARIKKSVHVPLQIGGGFRTMDGIKAAFDSGADRIIIGTAAVYNPALVTEALEEYGKGIAVSIDVSEDFVTVAGWQELSNVRFDDLARRMKGFGVQTLLFTDTRKDGTLSGPNLSGIELFLKAAAGSTVIVSGGITTMDDLVRLRELEPAGLSAVIIGKALYDRKLVLQDAMKVAGG
jgi:phosphoribosylformimino-5-aminoimidazole carboxamide ribotide isomerase